MWVIMKTEVTAGGSTASSPYAKHLTLGVGRTALFADQHFLSRLAAT
jgi:hypothetical protein